MSTEAQIFEPHDTSYILRQLARGNVVRFLGAGFSTLARNRRGEEIPAGSALAKQLWDLLPYDEPYEDEPLDEVYQAVLDSGVPHAVIRNFLEERLLATETPSEYTALTHPFWYRIYTTNIDNVIERIFQSCANRRLDTLAFPHDDLRDRDQFLETIQLVYLNGRLPCRPDEITFSPRQYAHASIQPQPLYEQFVRDYVSHPVIFVGTRLSEPLFWQHLAIRDQRGRGISEQRPKSYLVSRRIPPTKRTQLDGLNIVGVEAEVDSFLQWLLRITGELPTRIDTLKLANPGFVQLIEENTSRGTSEVDLQDFSLSFNPVPREIRANDARSLYLLGAAPRWDDFFLNLDAPRSITEELYDYVTAELDALEPRVSLAAILGSAGSGKSTILRRLGIRLSQAGRRVYLTNSEELPAPENLRKALLTLPERAVLLFDNSEIALSQLPDIMRALDAMNHPPILLIASRTNDFDRLTRKLPEELPFTEFPVPHLDRREVDAVLGILDQNSLLGELRGMNLQQRRAAFEQRAHHQILVAMREATTGKGFDVIIQDEFSKLVPPEAKALYLCTALATDAGYRLSREEFDACSSVAPAEALHLLARNLRDIVLPSGPNSDLLLLRHRLIAQVAVDRLAPRTQLREAYIRLLTALSPEVRGRHWRKRSSRFYKAIVNHKTIYQRFSRDIEEARSIYGAVSRFYGEEAHFWLQFGSLELEGDGGDLALAENYLRSALSLAPGDGYIENSLGHLFLRQAIEANSEAEARHLLAEGSDLLMERIESSRYQDDYAVHILCGQRYRWSKIWNYQDPEAHARELGWLRQTIERGVQGNPLSRRLRALQSLITRAYLQTVASDRPSDLPALDIT